MYHNPRRPFYKYHNDDLPQDATSPHAALIDSKRFWKLVKKITRQQEVAQENKQDDNDDTARVG